jgi:hypothetical protein
MTFPGDPVATLLDLAGADELHDDATAKTDTYAQLSRKYADQGDAFLAVMAAWAADVHVLQALLWERGLKAATEPDRQFFTVGTAVATALADYAKAHPIPTTAREAVEGVREGLLAAFDTSVHGLLAARFIDLEHLDGLPHPDHGAGERAAAVRLAGRSAPGLVSELLLTAKECMAVALEMRSAGLADDALRHAYLADMASFEAYLIEAAGVVGDSSLVTVDLRWGAATAAIAALPGLPTDVVDAATAIREQLAFVLGPVEAARLWACFEPIE